MTDQPQYPGQLAGWRYWLWRTCISGDGNGYHKNPGMIAACLRCGGPNVVVRSMRGIPDMVKRRQPTWYYACYNCDGYRDINGQRLDPETGMAWQEQDQEAP